MEEKEIYQLPAEGKMVEVTEEQYREFYKYKRKEKYLKEQDNKHKVYHYSDLDTDELLGEEMFSYPEEEGVEDMVVEKMLLEVLLQCVGELSEEEYLLIHALYYQQKTLDECAEQFGSCEKTIRNMRDRILLKLRKEMNIL